MARRTAGTTGRLGSVRRAGAISGSDPRRHHSSRPYPAGLALVVANTLNAGADIGAIAAAINLLVPIPAFVVIAPSSMVVVAGL
jgi:hypothetical protein